MRYLADDREVVAHYRAIAAASSLPIIIYNNPIAYGIDGPGSGSGSASV